MENFTGLTASISLAVTDADTAAAAGSGDVPVLATPRLVALCEEATCAALAGHLEEQMTTVGTRVELDHLAPTPVGDTVIASATVEKADGRKIVFSVHADDSQGLVATGIVLRILVNRETFLSKVPNRPNR